jgi:hypothetical protein
MSRISRDGLEFEIANWSKVWPPTDLALFEAVRRLKLALWDFKSLKMSGLLFRMAL